MKRTRSVLCTLAATGLLVAGCSDGPASPIDSDQAFQAPPPPLFEVDPTTPFTGEGVCMGDDAVEYHQFVSGINPRSDPTDFNCTSNDVRIAQAFVSAVDGDAIGADGLIIGTGEVPSCVGGGTVVIDLAVRLEQTANSVRYNIGTWIETGEGTPGGALTGECNHYILPIGEDGVSDINEDVCGDLVESAVVPSLHLGTIEVACSPGPEQQLAINSCIAWKVPAEADETCPAEGIEPEEDAFRAGTLPTNKSKCNCEPFLVPVTVLQQAELEVVKATDPEDDDGFFDLLINGEAEAGDVQHGGTTGPVTLGAGTTADPGAFHDFAEEAGTGTDLDDYSTSWQCTLAGSTTVISQCGPEGDQACSGTGAGPNLIELLPSQHVVCTFTNERKPQLRIAKKTDPSGDPTDFTFTPAGWNDDETFTRRDGQEAFASGNLTPGTYSATETVPSGWALTDRSCVFTGTEDAKDFTSISDGSGVQVTLAAGEDVTCTFENTKQAVLRIAKETDPSGDLTDFTFTPGGWNDNQTFTRRDGQEAFSSGFLAPGTYSATETVPSGWSLTDRSCVFTGTEDAKDFTSIADGTGVQVALAAGEDVTCTFENTKLGSITIIKRTEGGSGGPFGYTTTGGLDPSIFDLTTTAEGEAGQATQGFSNLSPGSYSVTESSLPDNWEFTSLVCSAGGTPDGMTANIALVAGAEVTCTFTNTLVPPPAGETAWAANSMECCSLRFNPGQGGNWATYLAYAEKTVGLFAGQTTLVGTVILSDGPGANEVTIAIELSGGWEFEPGSNVAIQGYDTAPRGNPSPGQFEYGGTVTGGTTATFTVPLYEFYAIHALVQE
jgi:hypothetical protein